MCLGKFLFPREAETKITASADVRVEPETASRSTMIACAPPSNRWIRGIDRQSRSMGHANRRWIAFPESSPGHRRGIGRQRLLYPAPRRWRGEVILVVVAV